MHSALSSVLAFLVISASYTIPSDGFSSVTPLASQKQKPAVAHRYPTSLHVFFGESSDNNNSNDEDNNNDDYDDDNSFMNHNNRFDLEKARQELEDTLSSHATTSSHEMSFYEEMKLRETTPQQQQQTTVRAPTYNRSPSRLPALDVTLPPAPPLTTIERERREAEIQLLGRLTDGDDSVSDLWTLWFGERGSEAAQKLLQAEELTNHGNSLQQWTQAEDILRDLIEEHGVYWVEPVNRLATLYYMTGRLDEAETLNKVVLAVKPWHFGALSGIVMIYAAQADSEKARLWAASRLPTFAPTGANRRRVAWAEKAVQSAEESLAHAEKRIEDLFGAPDDYDAMQQQQQKDDWNSYDEDGDSAWQ